MLTTFALAAAMLAAHDDPTPAIQPLRLYNTVNRPAMVRITPPHSHEGETEPGEPFVSLALLDVDGSVIDGPTSVQPGAIDLGQALPLIWEIREACWVQAMSGRAPFGPALVVQPMLTRRPPQTEQAVRPDGATPYTRIVGWGTPVNPEPHPADPAGASTNRNEEGKGDVAAPPPDGAASKEAPIVIEPQYFSGLRLYVERDVVLHTSRGSIRLVMRPDEAPNTAWNFLQLAEGGFYDGIIFHRIVPFRRDGNPFVIQAGDPTRTGNGDAGYWLPIEPSELPHDFGVISMARDDDPDSAGSQFFIALSREGTKHLDGQYCAFGYAVSGTETIRAIAAVELADVSAGRPVEPPVIERAELVPATPRLIGRGRAEQPVKGEPQPQSRNGRVPR